MAKPAEKLAESLEILHALQEKGNVAIKSAELTKVHRTRLLKNGFLKQVTKGWYISTPPDEQPGDSTSWYASYWHFCAGYLADRYGDDYFISPDQALLIHSGNWTVPQQLIIRTTKKANHSTPLPHGVSLWHWESSIPKSAQFIIIEGIRMLTLPSSLINCTPAIFTKDATDTRTALAMIKDSSEITGLLLEGEHSTIAGRLAGAFRNIERNKIADDILSTMMAAGYDTRETNPFKTTIPAGLAAKEYSPHINRIKLLWYEMRDIVIAHFPKAPGIPSDHEAYMKQVEDLYVTDAYHSLSIERYRVTPALVDKVRGGAWDITNNAEDKKQRDAMAARGYWQATQKLRESIQKILNGGNAGLVTDKDHGDWYRELFAPSVAVGLLKAADLAGYRNQPVYISGSKHVPMSQDAVRDVMPVLFELIQKEPEASVRAVLGHFIFVYIHPYMDGNGRMGRFLMNVMLASGGYPWTVIPVQERDRYMQLLEKASVDRDIEPFTKFIAYLVSETMKGHPVAGI
ncbi:MAG: Fic family protein [Chitinophagaceae bacterium]